MVTDLLPFATSLMEYSAMCLPSKLEFMNFNHPALADATPIIQAVSLPLRLCGPMGLAHFAGNGGPVEASPVPVPPSEPEHC